LLRVYDDESVFYEGQEGGFHISEIEKLLQQIKEFGNINISGATAFPAMICKNDKIEATKNAFAVLKAVEILKKNGIEIKQINLPSATCCQSIPKLKNLGATHGEPGHALTGTTPLHAISDQPEIPAAVYVSEISHNYKDNAYCFGGGYYRRSNIKNALVGKNAKSFNRTEVFPPQIDSIDYHFKLAGRQNIGDIVIMAFRFQAFVTRSDIVLIENIHSGRQIKIAGIYDSLGRQL
jgi:predicted amino acid racemase